MSRIFSQLISAAMVCFTCSTPASAQVLGWRGNWTGLYPDATPPLEWGRIPKGPMEDIRCSATKAQENVPLAPAEIAEVADGTITRWIVAGPFPVGDARGALDLSQLPNEAEIQPKPTDPAGNGTWRPLQLTISKWTLGEADLPWIKVGQTINATENSVGYACTYLRCGRAGKLRAVVEHENAMKVWINDKVVFNNTERSAALGYYTALGRRAAKMETASDHAFEFEVRQGWNRLLCKLVNPAHLPGDRMTFCLRLMDTPDVAYETRNIRWMAPLPNRSNATPILAGGKIFLMSEPDELVCLDSATGTKLWSRINDDYQALTPAERGADKRFAAEIDPLYAKLAVENDPDARMDIRRDVRHRLEAIDDRFKLRLTGHLAGHLGIVGFTTPTPCCDGKFIYVWLGNGVAACYDLDGQRMWITLIPAEHLAYACSPALIAGKFAVFMEKLVALDAKSGTIVWEQPIVNKNSGAVQPARIAGVDVIVSQQGEIVRASDGYLLYRSSLKSNGDTGWAAPTIVGDVIYLPYLGINNLVTFDCTGATGDTWQPKVTHMADISINRKPEGGWIDRWTAGSPLIWNGIYYGVDIWSTFYAVDLAAKKVLYRQDVDFHGFFHYNSIPVAASATLGGNHVFICDNQGTMLVLEPGRTFRQVAKNRIGTVLARTLPLPGQEAISYSPPVFAGGRIYIRGERYLYCIEEDARR